MYDFFRTFEEKYVWFSARWGACTVDWETP